MKLDGWKKKKKITQKGFYLKLVTLLATRAESFKYRTFLEETYSCDSAFINVYCPYLFVQGIPFCSSAAIKSTNEYINKYNTIHPPAFYLIRNYSF